VCTIYREKRKSRKGSIKGNTRERISKRRMGETQIDRKGKEACQNEQKKNRTIKAIRDK
jgi:hypothetical protein